MTEITSPTVSALPLQNTLHRLALVGPMGAGKTTVGRALAKRLSLAFFDSDHEVEARTGVTIPTIFAVESEAGFRWRESLVIDDLTQQTGMVLATGGGAILSLDNRRMLSSRCTVIYLRASPEEVFARIGHDRNRPLLQTADPLGTLRQLFALRDPLYQQAAHITIETRYRRCASTVALILAQLAAKAVVQSSA